MAQKRRTSIYFLFVLLFLKIVSFSQSVQQADSLINTLDTLDEKAKLKPLLELAKIYNNINIDSAVMFADRGFEIADELNLPKAKADFLKQAAQSYFFLAKYESAVENLYKSSKLYEEVEDTLGLLNSNFGLGIILSEKDDYQLSLQYAERALQLAKASNNREREAAVSDLIGDIYDDYFGNTDLAIEYYIESYGYFKSIGDEVDMAVSANKLGRAYTKIKNYSSAQKYLRISYDVGHEHQIKKLQSGNSLALGENYFAMGEYNKARQMLEYCIEQSKTQNKKFRVLALKALAKVDSAQGRLQSAFTTLKRYHNLYDSMSAENSRERLTELEAEHESEKKEATINLLEKDNEIQTLWRNSFIGAFIFAFILAVGLYNRYRYKNKTSKKLANLNNQLEGELKQAAEYIESLLPPKIDEKVKTDWKFIPSAHLGGDSFGYTHLDENHFAFYLIDVSGHGVGAALLSTSVLNILKSKSLPDTDFYNPAEVLNNLNNSFNMEEHDDKYFALWYGVIDLSNYELTCASAFHPPAIGISNGHTLQYGKKEMMIGAFEDYDYQNAHYQLSEGDSIFLFSDGCFELDLPDSDFEFDEFISLLREANDLNEKPVDYVYSSLVSIKKTNRFDDDFSIINVTL